MGTEAEIGAGFCRQGPLDIVSYHHYQEGGSGLMLSQLVLAVTFASMTKIPDTNNLREGDFILAHRFKGFSPS